MKAVEETRRAGICMGSFHEAFYEQTAALVPAWVVCMSAGDTRYAELDVTTNFSFLRGASHADELVGQAKALGLAAIGVADRNTLAGVVRAHVAAKEAELGLLVGARLDLDRCAGPHLLSRKTAPRMAALCAHRSRSGQGRGRKRPMPSLVWPMLRAHAEGADFHRAPAGRMELARSDRAYAQNLMLHAKVPQIHYSNSHRAAAGTMPPRTAPDDCDAPKERRCSTRHIADFYAALCRVKKALPFARLYLAASYLYRGGDRARIAALEEIARRAGTPLVASNAVLYHAPHRRALQDVLCCVREKTTIGEAGLRLEANAERHLKRPRMKWRGCSRAMRRRWQRTLEIVAACRFSLDELVYEYPDEPVPAGVTPQRHLAELTWEGAGNRFPDGVPPKVSAAIERELALINDLDFAPYFLTVYDIVAYARSRGILCQGRGSAANSVVCYCLGITAVNPTEVDLLFERFISEARREPPDIDVDFEHERREEVIQYIYARYGRDRAGLAATVISYRARSAVRDVGKAMGLSEDTVSALAGMVWGTRSGGVLPEKHIREAGLDPTDPLLGAVIELTQELMGFPRHLSQHVGGFVLTRGPLIEVVPVGNAAMADRTFIEWDKNDIAALGLMKIDVLALGMLTCIRKAFDLLEKHHDLPMTLAKVPRDDPDVYDMLCRADSIGVFQVESRAQMNMLPRLKPRCFLRSGHRGRDRASGADPGRHGASLSAPPLRAGRGNVSRAVAGIRRGR